MKKSTKKSIIAVCVIIPIVTVIAFIPRIIKNQKAKKYSTSY